jgi:hypothetical protein
MQVFELKADEEVVCPFCKQIILSNDDDSEPEECPHVLLIATDEGIEYCRGEINEEMLEEQAEESTFDEVISALDRPKAVLIKMYAGGPAFFGSYFLFEN